MSVQNEKKLQNLLSSLPQGAVATTTWLSALKISRGLSSKYTANGWLQSFGYGAFSRPHDQIQWFGALHTLQYQLKLDVHVGGKTALELQGIAHNIPMGRPTIDLLKAPGMRVPKWFKDHDWSEKLRITESSFLPADVELQEISMGNFNIRLSSRERALLELLYLTPRFYFFEEVVLMVESLGSLRGDILANLLKQCSSEKVKRLVLYFGDQQNHAWRHQIDPKEICIGTTLLKTTPRGGRYQPKYNLFLPNEYVIENEPDVRF